MARPVVLSVALVCLCAVAAVAHVPNFQVDNKTPFSAVTTDIKRLDTPRSESPSFSIQATSRVAGSVKVESLYSCTDEEVDDLSAAAFKEVAAAKDAVLSSAEGTQLLVEGVECERGVLTVMFLVFVNDFKEVSVVSVQPAKYGAGGPILISATVDFSCAVLKSPGASFGRVMVSIEGDDISFAEDGGKMTTYVLPQDRMCRRTIGMSEDIVVSNSCSNEDLHALLREMKGPGDYDTVSFDAGELADRNILYFFHNGGYASHCSAEAADLKHPVQRWVVTTSTGARRVFDCTCGEFREVDVGDDSRVHLCISSEFTKCLGED